MNERFQRFDPTVRAILIGLTPFAAFVAFAIVAVVALSGCAVGIAGMDAAR